jgi:hypothetical protein
MSFKVSLLVFIVQFVLNFYKFMLGMLFNITGMDYIYRPTKGYKVVIITSNTAVKLLYATNKLAPLDEFPKSCAYYMDVYDYVNNRKYEYYVKIDSNKCVTINNNIKSDLEFLGWRNIHGY